jgi:hypothetical protein
MIEAKIVRSIEEIISIVKEDYKSWNTTSYPWFRGEPANTKTPLLPKLYRPVRRRESHDENKLLQHFRMKAPSLGFVDTPPREHTDEWLFLAQHVGLPTRLLDWSEGLLAAIYFALKEQQPAVWMLDPVELNRKSINYPLEDNEFPLTWYDPLKSTVTKKELIGLAKFIHELYKKGQGRESYITVHASANLGNANISAAWELDEGGADLPVAIHPTNIHARMNTQKSRFTVQGKKKQCLCDLVDDRILRKYLIPREQINSFDVDLRMIGFTHTSAFPDLDNLAKELSDIF